MFYVFYEQYLTITDETIVNLLLCIMSGRLLIFNLLNTEKLDYYRYYGIFDSHRSGANLQKGSISVRIGQKTHEYDRGPCYLAKFGPKTEKRTFSTKITKITKCCIFIIQNSGNLALLDY